MNHRRIAAILAAGGALAGGLFATGAPQVALAAPASVFVYDGNGALDEGYTKFGTAAGRTVVTNATLPSDLSPYACVVLPINSTAFTGPQTTEFNTYVTAGGTIVALGDNSGFTAANTNLSTLSGALGAGLTIVNGVGSGPTTNIVASSLTSGMTSYGYAAGSTVTIASPGQSLVNQAGAGTQPSVIGAALLGKGVFVLSGDSNAFSDNDVSAYANNSNGVLVANLCAIRSTTTAVTCPALNAGQAVDCTVTVTDTKTAGHKTGPIGTVTVASDSGGTFANGGTCTLAATSTPGVSSCTISFTPNTSGNITATYAGDVRHSGSNVLAAAAVTAVPTLPKAGAVPVGHPAGGALALLLLVMGGAAAAAGTAVYRTRRVRS
ncbi:MAG: hypothetical protein WAT58_09005 [Candidatus Dormiibacterota bacterium]